MTPFIIFMLSITGFLTGWILAIIKLPYNNKLDFLRKVIAGVLMVVSFPLILFSFLDMMK